MKTTEGREFPALCPVCGRKVSFFWGWTEVCDGYKENPRTCGFSRPWAHPEQHFENGVEPSESYLKRIGEEAQQDLS